MNQKFKFPNVLAIMIGFILFSSLLAYIIPRGEYTRITDPVSDQITVVPGSFQLVEGDRLSVFQIFMSIPEGIIGRADLIVCILLLGGCFYVIEKTGALTDGIRYLTHKMRGREDIALIIVGFVFTAG
jgi:uncharacterized ion transporter superfamily protein YfcC